MKIKKLAVSMVIFIAMAAAFMFPASAHEANLLSDMSCPHCGSWLVLNTCMRDLVPDEASTHSVWGQTCEQMLYISRGYARCYECGKNAASYGWHDCYLEHSICDDESWCNFSAYRAEDGSFVF